MAHFRSTCTGHRGEASRLGTKSSGMRTTCNGWNIGATVEASYSDELQSDVIRISINHGSSNLRTAGTISVTSIDGKLRILQSDFPELLL